MMTYVLFYETAPDAMARIPEIYPSHRARVDAFHARGALLQVGTFENPIEQGSMGIFVTREAAEEFVREDPFVLNGIVASWKIWGWNQTFE
jgi:uncharacterized protein YciI